VCRVYIFRALNKNSENSIQSDDRISSFDSCDCAPDLTRGRGCISQASERVNKKHKNNERFILNWNKLDGGCDISLFTLITIVMYFDFKSCFYVFIVQCVK